MTADLHHRSIIWIKFCLVSVGIILSWSTPCESDCEFDSVFSDSDLLFISMTSLSPLLSKSLSSVIELLFVSIIANVWLKLPECLFLLTRDGSFVTSTQIFDSGFVTFPSFLLSTLSLVILLYFIIGVLFRIWSRLSTDGVGRP
jgi:hypothetical protein